MSRRLGLKSGKTNGTITAPASLGAEGATNDNDAWCVHDSHPAANERAAMATSDDSDFVNVETASATTAAASAAPDAVGRIASQSLAAHIEHENQHLDEDEGAKNEDDTIETESAYASDPDSDAEDDYKDDDTENPHNASLFLLAEDESEVVTATAVSMKRFGSTDLLSESESKNESE